MYDFDHQQAHYDFDHQQAHLITAPQFELIVNSDLETKERLLHKRTIKTISRTDHCLF
jgi:hypothetical protein